MGVGLKFMLKTGVPLREFILMEFMIVCASILISIFLMNAYTMVKEATERLLEDPDWTPEKERAKQIQLTIVPGVMINLKDATASHVYEVKWILRELPGNPCKVGDRIRVMKNLDGYILLEKAGHIFAMSREYADGIRVEVDEQLQQQNEC